MVVTIPVVCPHCDETFQVNPDLQGKTMRCPECRETFVVEAPIPKPVPVHESGPILDATPYEGIVVGDNFPPMPVQEASVPTLQPMPDVPTLQPLPDVPTAKSVPVAPQLPSAPLLPGPKEVVWSGDDVPPTQPPAAPPRVAPVVEEDDRPFIRRRRTRPPWAKALLWFLSFALVVTLVGIGVGLYRHYVLAEDRLREEAETAYKDGNYPLAQTKYQELVVGFERSSLHESYKFFAALSETLAVIGAVTSRENPEPARRTFEKFVEDFGQTTFAQPETGYGSDIVGAGRKLADTYADYAGDHLKKYRDELKSFKTNEEELRLAEEGVKTGREKVLPLTEKYLSKDSLDPQRKKYDDLAAQFAAERHRLAVLAPYRGIVASPTAELIKQFQITLKENKLSNDPEALKMIFDAEAKLRTLIVPVVRNIPATIALPVPPAILFAMVVPGVSEPRLDPDAQPDVVLAAARGVLYALDAHSGNLLWGLRVAPPTADPRTIDLPIRVSVGGGTADIVLVTGQIDQKAGLTARDVRSGDALWYQALEAPAAGRPVVVGGRVYLPLRDQNGTVAEFEITTGTRTRDLTIRQPLAGGLGVLPGPRPGSYFLVVPGHERRTFIYEVGREDAAGVQLQPRCVRVLLTDHPQDSLRGEPLLITPAEGGDGPRFMVLAQTDGPTTTKLRAYPLPPPDELAPPGDGPPEEATPRPHEVTVPGWSWFPAMTDGERIILATDAGAFLAIGVNQLGNADRPLFTLPAPKPTADQDVVARSQVVHADEDSYWAVVNGQLIRLRTALDPAGGFRIVPQGNGRVVGEPVNRAQVRPGIKLGVVVVRPVGSPTVQVVAFDLQSGDLRWKRRLGITPAGPPVSYAGGPAVFADEDGSVYSVGSEKLTDAFGTGVAATQVAPSFEGSVGRATTTATADGKTVWVLASATDTDAGRQLRIRKITEGKWKADSDVVVPLPDQLAGSPIAFGEGLLMPLANGYVHRYAPGDTKLSPGPLWRSGDGNASECFLTAVTATEFLATDGGRKFYRYTWATSTEGQDKKVPMWEAKEKFAVAPVVVRIGGDPRFVAAETSGIVLLFNPNIPGDPVQRWVPGKTKDLPTGKPTDRLATVPGDGRDLVVYSIDRRHLVAIDPVSDTLAWTQELVPAGAGELTGWVTVGGRVIATTQTAQVAILEGPSGSLLGLASPGIGGAVATSVTVPVGADRGVVVLTDGTAAPVTLPLGKK